MRNYSISSHKVPVTWFVVADGRNVQVYTYNRVERLIPLAGNAKHHHYDESWDKVLVPVAGMKMQAEPYSDYETGNDRLGRVFESQGSAHHMSEPHTNIHEEIKHNFMKTIAVKLSMAETKKAFDRLVLVAPAKMLGELKNHLPDSVLKSVVAELSKDLTGCDVPTLSQHLKDIR